MLQKKSKGIEENMVLDTDNADDIAILDDLEDSPDVVPAGLRINAKNTQCMAISRNASQHPHLRSDNINLEVEGEPVE